MEWMNECVCVCMGKNAVDCSYHRKPEFSLDS